MPPEVLALVDAAVGGGQLSSASAANLKRWLQEPPFARYREPLIAAVRGGEFARLESLFWEVIPFGTGGRRGTMAPFGSATINERTIAESAHGLATYLHKATGRPGGRGVIAHDTRNRSREFAELTATTFAAHGLQVYFFEGPRSTPELSFAVRHLKCDVGVVVSASHNPPADNGFKAYWSDGAQVLAPHDKGIIQCVYEAGEIPAVDFHTAVADGRIIVIGAEDDQAYIDSVRALSLSPARDVQAIFTPLHGVGETSVYKVLEAAGFRGLSIFAPQRVQDGNFPAVPDQLPNPERAAVFQPAIAEAQQTGATLVIASDPDADRLGAAVRGADGKFVVLSGNRIGALVADYILRKRQAAGTLTPQHYVVETLVTTPLIAALAKSAGVRAIDDLLVGFKYIAQTMEREGPDRFVFGAEESLGYLAGTYARDKDAAVAGLYLMELAAELQMQGRTLLDQLDALFVAHGYHIEDQRSHTCEGPRGKELFQRILAAFRDDPPRSLGGMAFKQARDYGRHEVRALPSNQRAAALPEPQGDLIFFDAAAGEVEVSVAVRPSGTEPKIKFYFFARAGVDRAAALPAVRARTDAALQTAMQELDAWVRRTASV